MQDQINTEEILHELMKNRWSSRAFDSREVEDEKIGHLLEAARWSPSAFNEQPWRFVVGKKGDEKYEKILASLIEWNQQWAKHAPVLILNISKKEFSHNGQTNNTYHYDLGQAVFAMVIEATNQGLMAHQMSGFDAKKAEANLSIPEGFEVISVTAFGYQGDDSHLSEDMRKGEKRERVRKAIDELLF